MSWNIEESTLLVPRHMRYYHQAPREGMPYVWYFHGYGQAPAWSAQKLRPLVEAGWGLIAPEGFNRFYLEGHSGRVGASWMTREARLDDIADQHAFFNALWQQFGPNHRHIAFAFSQGVPAFWRWYAAFLPQFETAIHYASDAPPELLASNFPHGPIQSATGVFPTQDEFISPEKAQGIEAQLQSWPMRWTFLHPTTTHRIDVEVVKNLLSRF